MRQLGIVTIYANFIIIYQSRKFFFSCVSLVESVSREIEEMKLSHSRQRTRDIMHYSPVSNKKITRTRDLWTAENYECFVNHIVYRIKFNRFF